MLEIVEANPEIVSLAGVLALVLLLWLLVRGRKAGRVRSYRPDVLDEGMAPAARNQALIDAPSATEAALARTVAEVAPASASPVTGDDLSRIKGLGPKLQALLPELGLSTYAQIAALDEAALDALDGKLGAFAGRPRRDNWAAQARFLADDDQSGFEAQFGKLS